MPDPTDQNQGMEPTSSTPPAPKKPEIFLSQEEIDALLEDVTGAKVSTPPGEDAFSGQESSETSQTPLKVHGVIIPAQNKGVEPNIFGQKLPKGAGNEIRKKEQLIDVEKIKLVARLEGRIDTLLRETQALYLEQLETLPTTILDQIDGFSTQLKKNLGLLKSDDAQIQPISADVDSIEKELGEIKESIHLDTIEQISNAQKVENLLQTQANYFTIKNDAHVAATIASLRLPIANTIPNKDEILSTYDGLSWLGSLDKIKTFAKSNDVSKIAEIDTILEYFTQSIFDAGTTLYTIANAFQETKERLTAGGKVQSDKFAKLKSGSGNLRKKVLDTGLVSLHDGKLAIVQQKEKEFNATPSDTSLTAFDTALEEYTKIVEEMREKQIVTVAPPAFLSRTMKDTHKDQKGGDTLALQDGDGVPAPSSVDSTSAPAKNESIEGLFGDWKTGYKIHVDKTERVIKNKKIPGTLLRYQDIRRDSKYNNVDFAPIEALKDEVMRALSSGEMSAAGEKAFALGQALNEVTKEVEIPVVTDDKTTPDVSKKDSTVDNAPNAPGLDSSPTHTPPEAIAIPDKKESRESIEGLFGDWKTGYKIHVDGMERVITDEKIPGTLLRYKNFVRRVKNNTDVDLAQSNILRVSVMDALKSGDFAKADEHARALGSELSRIELEMIILGTSKRYESLLNDPVHTGKDFSKATVLNDAIHKAVEDGDILLADEKARALGQVLNALTNVTTKEQEVKSPPVDTPHLVVDKDAPPTPEKSETPEQTIERQLLASEEREARKRSRFYQNIRPLTISQDKDGNWRIKKGTGYPFMSQEELSKWIPLHTILLEYQKFVDSESIAHDYSSLVILKNEILSCVENGDYSTAQELALVLQVELDPKLDKEFTLDDAMNTPAARRRYNSREDNLAKIRSYDTIKLGVEDTEFAFIKDSGPPHARTLKIIDRNTGDWVRLTKEDLEAVELARSVLTNFKIRTSTPPGSIEKKNAVLAHINAYDFENAARLAHEYFDEFATLTRSPPLRPKMTGLPGTPPSSSASSSTKKTPEQIFEEKRQAYLSAKKGNGTPGMPQNPTDDIDKTRERNRAVELQKLHAEMFARNPKRYREVYANKNSAHDKLTNEVVTRTLMEIPQAPNRSREEFLKDLVGMTPREILADLTVKKSLAIKRKIDLQAQILGGVTTSDSEVEIKDLDNEIQRLGDEIQKYTSVMLTKYTPPSVTEPLNYVYADNKQVYSPARDASLNSDRGIGRNYVLDYKGKPVKIDRAALTPEQFNDTYSIEPSEYSRSARNELDRQEEKVQLSDSPYPNHKEGMVTNATTYTNEVRDGMYVPESHVESATEQDEEEEIPAPTAQPAPDPAAPERQAEKMKRQSKLFNAIAKAFNPKTAKQWFTLGLATIGITAGGAMALGKYERRIEEDKRLIDEIKSRPKWENFVGEKVSEQFIKEFSGPGKLTFDELMIKNAPSFNINQNNPSAKDKLAALLCKNVYFVIGADAGITEPQQVECSMLVENLKEILIAAKASVGVLYSQKDVEDGTIFKDMTIREFYDEVTKAVVDAEADRARLQSIKK